MKPLRGFYGNLNICGHGESLLCSWSICPIRFSVFFVCFFLDLLGQLTCSLQFSAAPPVWRKWHKQCMLSLRRNLWVVYLKKKCNGPTSNTWRQGELSQPMVPKVEFPASSINITWNLIRNAVSQALARPSETLGLGPCDLIHQPSR